MTEAEFAKMLVARISPLLPQGIKAETRKALLYGTQFDDKGKLELHVNVAKEPKRGKGMGFEQDILVFEEVDGSDTSIIPRVAVEVKLSSVTTHDAIVYSQKVRRIRAIYPFCRFGLVIGGFREIPTRILRHGQDFDFTCAVSPEQPTNEVHAIASIVNSEIETSRLLGALLFARTKASLLWRKVEVG